MTQQAAVEAIYIGPEPAGEMTEVSQVEATAGIGLSGDRYGAVRARSHAAMIHRTGLRCETVTSGSIAVGAAIEPVE